MASTTQVEFQAVEVIPNETARVQVLGEESEEKDEVSIESSESKTEASEPKASEFHTEPTPPAPDASNANVLPLATVAAAVSFMTLAAASFFVMRQRRRSALAADTDRAIKDGNALDATVTDETASHTSSRSKTNTSEFGAEDMETTSWYE